MWGRGPGHYIYYITVYNNLRYLIYFIKNVLRAFRRNLGGGAYVC